MLSFLQKQAFPTANPENFEDWVTNQFGERLFNIFFKTYTEKVWGMSCNEISADWAAQRIKGLDLWSAMSNALRNSLPRDATPKKGGQSIKTLIDIVPLSAQGPRHDVGRGCAPRSSSAAATSTWARGSTSLRWDEPTRHVDHRRHRRPMGNGSRSRRAHVISSAPIRELVGGIRPQPACKAGGRRACATATSSPWR